VESKLGVQRVERDLPTVTPAQLTIVTSVPPSSSGIVLLRQRSGAEPREALLMALAPLLAAGEKRGFELDGDEPHRDRPVAGPSPD
jgi:hypothetical protein